VDHEDGFVVVDEDDVTLTLVVSNIMNAHGSSRRDVSPPSAKV
jgi:hypothetical protein